MRPTASAATRGGVPEVARRYCTRGSASKRHSNLR
jgi:hypothetical protein